MKIRVLTYNIHRAIGLDRRFRPERIVKILTRHDADIVLLQEVDEGAPRSRELHLARELAKAADYPYFAFGHNVSLRKGRYGNATLSRYPILRERNIDLTIGRRKRRGCQHTTLDLSEDVGRKCEMEIFNLHLGLSARERAKQVGVLARSSEFGGLDERESCIVGGDFNDWRSRLRIFFVEALRFHCATDRELKRGTVGIKTFPSVSPQGALDKVYYRGPLRMTDVRRCRMELSRVASDHLPVVVDFVV